MHDASHSAISRSAAVNGALTWAWNACACWDWRLWHRHHVFRHHSFTGDVLRDPDTVPCPRPLQSSLARAGRSTLCPSSAFPSPSLAPPRPTLLPPCSPGAPPGALHSVSQKARHTDRQATSWPLTPPSTRGGGALRQRLPGHVPRPGCHPCATPAPPPPQPVAVVIPLALLSSSSSLSHLLSPSATLSHFLSPFSPRLLPFLTFAPRLPTSLAFSRFTSPVSPSLAISRPPSPSLALSHHISGVITFSRPPSARPSATHDGGLAAVSGEWTASKGHTPTSPRSS